jgi:hypothetical protein
MFSGILMPIIRSLTTVVTASDLPLQRGGSSVVGRGRSGPDRPRQAINLSDWCIWLVDLFEDFYTVSVLIFLFLSVSGL